MRRAAAAGARHVRSGPDRYGLARELARRGVECVVAAPSKIPRAAGDRVTCGCCWPADGKAWTQRHRDWLADVALAWPAAQATMLDAQGAIDALAHRRDALDREIVALLPGSPWAGQVALLRCQRGIETLTAVGLCVEICDFERFAKAEQLMSYVGLVPSEATTGQKRRLGAITKTGSGHARRLLVEAAWHYRPRPRIGKALAECHDGQPAEAPEERRRAKSPTPT